MQRHKSWDPRQILDQPRQSPARHPRHCHCWSLVLVVAIVREWIAEYPTRSWDLHRKRHGRWDPCREARFRQFVWFRSEFGEDGLETNDDRSDKTPPIRLLPLLRRFAAPSSFLPPPCSPYLRSESSFLAKDVSPIDSMNEMQWHVGCGVVCLVAFGNWQEKMAPNHRQPTDDGKIVRNRARASKVSLPTPNEIPNQRYQLTTFLQVRRGWVSFSHGASPELPHFFTK